MLATLVVAVTVFSVTQGMIIPGVGHIAADFDISASTATWVLSGNLALMAVCLPLLGRIGDMVGRRRVLVVSLAFLTLGGVIAALAPSFPWLVGGRVIQGIGGGTFSMAYGLARENLPLHRQATGVAVLASAAGVGGAVGPALGGAIIDAWGYHAIFWLNAVTAAGALIGVIMVVPDIRRAVLDRVDLMGACVLAVGVTLPLVVVSRTPDLGWSDIRTVLLLAASVLVLVALVPIERRRRSPLIDVATLLLPRVALINTATVLAGAANFAVLVLVPQLAQSERGGLRLDATQAGLLLLPGSVAMLIVGIYAGRIGRRIGNRLLLVTERRSARPGWWR